MAKGDPNKPRGKMSSYTFFVQTCREEHKKKHLDSSVNFSEFSKKCSERWKVRGVRAELGGCRGVWGRALRGRLAGNFGRSRPADLSLIHI